MSYEDFFHSMTPYSFHVKKSIVNSKNDEDEKESEEGECNPRD